MLELKACFLYNKLPVIRTVLLLVLLLLCAAPFLAIGRKAKKKRFKTIRMQDALSLSTSSAPPSYDDIAVFLSAIARWLQQAGARLGCVEQTTRLNHTLQLLDAFNAGGVAAGDSSKAVAALENRADALLSLTLSVLRSSAVLAGLSYVVVSLLSWTTPGLRTRHHASHLHAWLQRSYAAIERDVLLGKLSGAWRRRTNKHQLLAARVCTGMAAILILLLLTMQVWSGLVLWQLWEWFTAPVWQAWTWASAASTLPSRYMPDWMTAMKPVTATPLSSGVANLVTSLRLPDIFRSVPELVWHLMQQLQLLYFWHLSGSVLLGLSLSLLRFAHQRMDAFNGSLPYVTSRATEPPLLQQLREAEERRQNREMRRLQLESTRLQQLLIERVESAALVGGASSPPPPPVLLLRQQRSTTLESELLTLEDRGGCAGNIEAARPKSEAAAASKGTLDTQDGSPGTPQSVACAAERASLVKTPQVSETEEADAAVGKSVENDQAAGD